MRNPALPTPSFDRPTDKWGQRPRWTASEIEAHQALDAAFRAWAADHESAILWPAETALAEAIASVLGVELVIDGG